MKTSIGNINTFNLKVTIVLISVNRIQIDSTTLKYETTPREG